MDPKRELSPELRGKLVENARRAQMISMAYVMHPTDAETIDLTRWGASGGLLVPGGYGSSGESASTNIFGGPEIQRVISPSVPQGTALLADWSTIRLYVREQINVLLDISGELFKSNQFIARGEGRFGIGVLRPSAIADIDLTP